MSTEATGASQAVYLLLYHGKGDWQDALIRWWSGSPYSHCEIRVGDVDCYTSHQARGGVAHIVREDFTQWAVLPLPGVTAAEVLAFYEKTRGQGYNWLGVVFNGFHIPAPIPGLWHCAQWCARLLRMPFPVLQRPHSLYAAVGRMILADHGAAT